VRFLVIGDGRVLYRGPWQQRDGPAVPFEADLRGVRSLRLSVDVRGEPFARADWIDPTIVHDGLAPVAVPVDPNEGEILRPTPAGAYVTLSAAWASFANETVATRARISLNGISFIVRVSESLEWRMSPAGCGFWWFGGMVSDSCANFNINPRVYTLISVFTYRPLF
jgi:NPCBM/NEW2 domain